MRGALPGRLGYSLLGSGEEGMSPAELRALPIVIHERHHHHRPQDIPAEHFSVRAPCPPPFPCPAPAPKTYPPSTSPLRAPCPFPAPARLPPQDLPAEHFSVRAPCPPRSPAPAPAPGCGLNTASGTTARSAICSTRIAAA